MTAMMVTMKELAGRSMQRADAHYGLVSHAMFYGCGQVVLERGFYFLIVTCGTASLSDAYQRYTLSARNLVVLTPGVRAVLTDMSDELSLTCLYIEPDYFDTLSVGQLLYNQISSFVGNYRLPVFQLEQEQLDYLLQTLALFAGRRLERMHLYRDGTVRHLCSFLLLQLSDTLYLKNRDCSGCVKRAGEIFRQFKRLLVHHYREHHGIGFYADRLNISTAYLSRVVRSITGHTVCFHISELLCADARKLLECTNLSVKEIADTLGFSDQSVFGKFFIRKTGLSPMKFRSKRGASSPMTA